MEIWRFLAAVIMSLTLSLVGVALATRRGAGYRMPGTTSAWHVSSGWNGRPASPSPQ